MLTAIAPQTFPAQKRPRVLIVDDEANLVEVLRDLLVPLKCTVKVARSVGQAKRLLAKEAFELVLADVNLPDGDGLSLLPVLNKRQPTARAIILTGAPSVEFAVTALRGGAVDFVAKPFQNESLLDRIRTALSQQVVVSRQQHRLIRLRSAVKRLGISRRMVSKKVDLLCNDLVAAYGELSKQVDTVRTEESFRKQITGVKDLEQMLCQTMDWLVRQIGLSNVALWLATDSGDFQLGAYMKYTAAGEPPVVRAMHQGVLPLAMQDGFLHITGNELVLARNDEVCTPLLDQDVAAVTCTYLGEPLASIVFFREQSNPFTENDLTTIRAIAPVFAASLAGTVHDPSSPADANSEGDLLDGDSSSHSADDWWKRGEQPPF